jgi:hypothetical protein
MISFRGIRKGNYYSRHILAETWGYASYYAIARGVITPKNDNKIVLFVTEQKQKSATQYADRLNGNVLSWEGPNDHFAEDRIVGAQANGEQIHVFYRVRHHGDFRYCGVARVIWHRLLANRPSRFRLWLR